VAGSNGANGAPHTLLPIGFSGLAFCSWSCERATIRALRGVADGRRSIVHPREMSKRRRLKEPDADRLLALDGR